jgi:hypothetical protein
MHEVRSSEGTILPDAGEWEGEFQVAGVKATISYQVRRCVPGDINCQSNHCNCQFPYFVFAHPKTRGDNVKGQRQVKWQVENGDSI